MQAAQLKIHRPFTAHAPHLQTWNPWEFLTPLLVVALAVLAMAAPQLTAAWELNRIDVAQGQWWRLVTGHFTHWNVDHLFWDAATFFALAVVCLRRGATQTVACLFVSSIAISATVLTAHAELASYRGLSGLDTALFTLAATTMWRDSRQTGDRALGAVAKWALGGLMAKTAYELATGATLFVDSETAGFIPLASAHAVGGVIGVMSATISRSTPSA